MAVDWERIGQPAFDRIVEAVVHRVHDAAARVEAVNGRGGDDGIDIKVSRGSRIRVFQLKYYPDGFPTASHKGRRGSIKASFTRAMRGEPEEWVLVVPCVLTPTERAFVRSLADGLAVEVQVWDRATLDGLLAVHADLEASFTRDQLFEAAKVYGQERALLMGGVDDVSARVRALGGQADGLDDHWTIDSARQGDTVVHTLRGKHPRAHEVSPVMFTLTGIGPLAPEQSEAVRRSLGYGLDEKVVLPHGAVEKVTVTGPEFLGRELENAEVRWGPTEEGPAAGVEADLVFLDGDQITASYPGKLKHLGLGSVGRSVRMELAGGRLQLLMPENPQTAASLTFSFSLEGLEPAAALRVLRLHRRMADGGIFEVRTGAGAVGGGEIPPSAEAVYRDFAQLQLFLEDLEVVQRHSEQYFPVPGELTRDERIVLRVARLLADGHCVVCPFLPEVRLTLNGRDTPATRALLGGEVQPLHLPCEAFPVQIAGRRLELGPVFVSHPEVAVAAGSRGPALAALTAGRGDGVEVGMRPVGGGRFRLVLQRSPNGSGMTPVPLGLPGFREPH
ncbi:hypothetical protein [Streptomyces pseudovenezuelae]|uniref:Restriction endonuclease type IV Mrr domain-containing protein n=1 Tax=Streptomyces pseudovenezuelae TaxID=67350 RepID=A0ABT6M2V7_9ACTN|nr:hypothetical protein [Streptomyces pseudovenezuelae]MDH6222887.1 hypothetical protein [Streptomyces pseudovenezuelae]